MNGDDRVTVARRLELTRASTIPVRPVRWLWQGRVPLSALSLLGGREGVGKTVAAMTLTADVTRGRLDGIYHGDPRSVIIAATEDSWEHTIVPRLMAAGADLERVFRVDVITSESVETALLLPRDLAALERIILDQQIALVILDPLMSRLDARLDTHKDAEVRQALEPVVTLAGRTGTAFIGLIHVNKSASSDALTTLMGSRAFAAVARSVLFVMTDPDDEDQRLLGVAKNNLGRTDLPTLGFRVVGIKVADTCEGPIWTGKLEWTGEASRSIREALEVGTETSGDRSATSEAADWLQDYLSSQDNHAADFARISREAGKAGHSKNALRRAKERLGVMSVTSGFPRRACWHLPVVPSCGETLCTGKNGTTGSTETPVGPVIPVGPVAQVPCLVGSPDGSPHSSEVGEV